MSNPEIIVRNTKNVDEQDLRVLGGERWAVINNKAGYAGGNHVKAKLKMLGRADTIRRSSSLAASIDGMLATTQDEKMDAFVVTDVKTNRFRGMATIQPNLELFRQNIPGPTRIVRRLAAITREKSLGKSFTFNRPVYYMDGMVNVAAWVSTPDPTSEVSELSFIYNVLRQQNPEQGAWTLLPTDPRLDHLKVPLLDNGFEAVQCSADTGPTVARFDDESSVGLRQAPKSVLYTAPSLV